MTKLCGDDKCERAGQELPLSNFWFNKNRRDGRDFYCSKCRYRRQVEFRERKRLTAKTADRKPDLIARAKDPLVKVYWAIVQGCRTRPEIQKKTKLTYDKIGDVLVILVWEYKVLKIENEQFVLTDPENAIAA